MVVVVVIFEKPLARAHMREKQGKHQNQKEDAPKMTHPHEFLNFCKLLHLDFNLDAAGQFELHQRVNSLSRAAVDVDKALVGAHLELFAALLVDEG